MKLFFVKGQMGGNRIVVMNGAQVVSAVGPERRLDLVRQVASADYGAAHEVVLVYPTATFGEADIEVEVYDPTIDGLIETCCGASQVLCSILQTNRFSKWLMPEPIRQPDKVFIEYVTGSGERLKSWSRPSGSGFVTDMTAFAQRCFALGVGSLLLASPIGSRQVWQVGSYMLVELDQLLGKTLQSYSNISFLEELHREFKRVTGVTENNVVVYDSPPVFFRATFPHDIATGYIQPSCGTGSVALALMLLDRYPDSYREGELCINVECGGNGSLLGGPDVAAVRLRYNEDEVLGAEFIHDNVTVTTEGYFVWSEMKREGR